MEKLKLKNIKKTYKNGEVVTALKEISIGFRENELVSILGPSGCGKTTLLNIIGGLDQYDSGDLIIDGLSTKQFKNSDWDAYRNHSIGFVFQGYNLIGHQTVLQNVEIAMTLSGVSASERKQRAEQALKEVGLSAHLSKKPNQLSGGQMQRVAIARALVNNPDIILADEPTGALDSHTSVQVMDILKEIAKTRLVIMVTHNSELAEEYSDRTVSFLDGEIQSDSNPLNDTEIEVSTKQLLKTQKFKKTSMSLFTAASLSFKNLLTKRTRTIITAFAGSIGIIGVALVLALSNGLSNYIDRLQSDTLSNFPIIISSVEQTIIGAGEGGPGRNSDTDGYIEYPQENIVYSYDSENARKQHSNVITQDYLNYVELMETELPNTVNNVSYTQGININLLAKGQDTVVKFETMPAPNIGVGIMGNSNTYWNELPGNNDLILSQYNLIGEGSRMPNGKNEVALVVDKYNRIDKAFFDKAGITNTLENDKLTDFIGKTILKVVPNNDFYLKNGDLFSVAASQEYEKLYEKDTGIKLTITGILRPKEDVSSGYMSPGIAYTTSLIDAVIEEEQKSEIAIAQKDANKDVLTGTPFNDEKAKEHALVMLGAVSTPIGINIYPKDFESKEQIKKYLDTFNNNKDDDDQLIYSDQAETISSITGTLLNTVTYVLTGFAGISLLVSTIMIGIITYVSVIERTKEIGILRSVGARKKDISRVFNAETLIIGFTAGALGIVITYLLTILINSVIENLTSISGIASLNPFHAVSLIAGSMLLTLMAGVVPSRMAAKKDPVAALRSE